MVQTRGAGQDSHSKLKFKDKLVGKGLATDALLKKLKVLQKELQELDQEQVDVNSLSAVRKELVNTTLLLHKDRGVKAYTACCLADILRLYAPDAPYTQGELQDIFEFFFRQLVAGLHGADSAYYNEYYHLLESLSGVKSVVLVCDLPKADSLMVTVFKELFALVKRDLPKKIEMFMADILVALIDECQSLPADVLEKYLLPQFRGKHARMDQPGYRLAVSVCNAAADKLQRHVCQYFTDVIVDHSNNEEYDEISAAHDLIKHLNRSCPSLLHNVVPQLEEELRADDTHLRVLATQVLGEMFAEKGGKTLLAKYPSTWEFWLGRRMDKDTVVRVTWVEATRGLILNLAEMRDTIEGPLQEKIYDPDEKVRTAVCKMYSTLDYETALHHVSAGQLKIIGSRSEDRKLAVRVQSLNCLGKMFNMAYTEIENNDPAAVEHFAWIPQRVLQGLKVPEIKPTAEQVLHDHILPFPTSSNSSSTSKGQTQEIDETAWTDRLLLVMKYIDDQSVKALLSISGLKIKRPSQFEKYLQACADNNGGVIDEDEENIKQNLTQIARRLATVFPDFQKALDDLQAFAKLNEGRLYKLLRTCTDTQTDLKGLIKATNDFRRRLEQSSPALLPTMEIFLRRAMLRIVNQSSIPTLIKRVQKGDPTGNGHGTSQAQLSANNAQTFLTFISKHCPALYKPHLSELTKALADDRNPRVTEVSLQALAAVSRWDKALAPSDKRTVERVVRFVQSSNHRHAKFSARLLAYSKEKQVLCEQAVDSLADALSDADAEQVVAHLAGLAQFATAAPDAFEQRSDVIMAFLLKRVLHSPSPPDPGEDDSKSDWVPDHKIWPELRAKMLALKICRKRCLALASDEGVAEIATPVLKLLFTLLNNDGSLKPDSGDDPKTQGRLRLQAAVSLLHLATVKQYAEIILQTSSFLILAITTQDSCFEIRLNFITKLITLLGSSTLDPAFNIIPFLTVHDPEAEVTTAARTFVQFAVRSFPQNLKVERFELMFIRFLHLLAHHPDFDDTHEALCDIAKYIQYYVHLVANAENISLLYHLAQRAKSVRDAESQAYSENLYRASELAQETMKARAHAQGWTLNSYPGKVKIPTDILRPLPSVQAGAEIAKKVYLSEKTIAWVAERGKPMTKPRAERKVPAKRKAPSSRANGKAKRSRRRKRVEQDDDDDDDNDDDDDDDEDEENEKSKASEDEMDVDERADEGNGRTGTASPEREERLGRGARTRAMAKIKQQTKQKKKPRPSAATSDSE